MRGQAAKGVIKEKDDLIAKNLKLARKLKDAFDVDLKAAKKETTRFREMLQNRADVDDNFKVRCGAMQERKEESVASGVLGWCRAAFGVLDEEGTFCYGWM